MLLVAMTAWSRGAVQVASVSSGPDMGGKIAYARGGAIYIYTAGNQRQLTAGPKDALDKHDAMPSISLDGTQVVYTRLDEGYSDLYKLSIDNPSATKALTNNRPTVDVGQVEVPGVKEGYNKQALWADYPAWSPAGDRIAFTSDIGTEYPHLRSISPNGGASIKLGGGIDFSQQTVEHPSWEPTGRKIAVANYSGTDRGVGQIWSYNLATERWSALTNAKEGAYDPAWSPDGEWIAFTMRENGEHNIYVIPTDATKWTEEFPTPIQLTDNGASRAPAWSPDGTKLAFISLEGTSFDLYVGAFAVDAGDHPSLEQPRRLTENANIDAPSGLSWGK